METPPSALTTYSMYIIMEGFYRVRETHYAEAQREKQYISIYWSIYAFYHIAVAAGYLEVNVSGAKLTATILELPRKLT